MISRERHARGREAGYLRPMRAPAAIAVLATLTASALTVGCKSAEECKLTSTVDGFEPSCTGELITYVGETRLFLYGTGGSLTAYLPPDLGPGTYGGNSGNGLTVIFDTGTDQELANERLSTVTVAWVEEAEAQVRIAFEFEGGQITGPLNVPVTRVDGGADGTDTGT